VWLVDLGLVAKVRPAVVLSVRPGDADRELVTVIPHTTSVRRSRFEAVVPVRFLREGAFDAQGIVTIPSVRLVRRLGRLDGAQLRLIETCLALWLGLPPFASPATPG
jgi:mRNA interferase MazF